MAISQAHRAARQERARRIRRRGIPGVDILSREEGKALFDFQARKLLGISGDEFLRRLDAGEYEGPDETPEARKVNSLVMLLPFARRTPA
jgi:hypothetical protein